jgi:hypothetical protein
MKIPHLSIVMATSACGMLLTVMLVPDLCPWLARESIFEFTAREPKNRNPAEPAAGAPQRQVVIRKLRMGRHR